MSRWILHIVSDSTGETAEKMLRAALMQFDIGDFRMIRHHGIRREKDLQEVLAQVHKGEVVACTLVQSALRDQARKLTENMEVLYLDLLGPLLGQLAEYLQVDVRNMPGLQHRMEAGYRRRIEAVEYSVKHDDGLGLKTLAEAEIVIAGVSRTGKTPLSIYLANRGFRVANVPLVMGIPVPRELEEAERYKVIGLYVAPDILRDIREIRLRKLGSRIRTGYTEHDEVEREVTWARKLYGTMGWHTIDVSRKAVEEVATEIEEVIAGHA